VGERAHGGSSQLRSRSVTHCGWPDGGGCARLTIQRGGVGQSTGGGGGDVHTHRTVTAAAAGGSGRGACRTLHQPLVPRAVLSHGPQCLSGTQLLSLSSHTRRGVRATDVRTALLSQGAAEDGEASQYPRTAVASDGSRRALVVAACSVVGGAVVHVTVLATASCAHVLSSAHARLLPPGRLALSHQRDSHDERHATPRESS
jgi:hypothetical protein